MAKQFVFGVGPVNGKTFFGRMPDVPEVRRLAVLGVASGLRERNVVMVRLSEEALVRIDQLVEAGIVDSRSEAAAVLINAGGMKEGDAWPRNL